MNASVDLELLEKTHDFPCLYMFKIIGKADQAFLAKVIAAVREELALETDPPYRVRESVGGRHISVTMEPMVQSARQVHDVYQRLSKLEQVVMLF